MAARAAKRAEKKIAKERPQKIAENEWIPIDGAWAGKATVGRGHQEGPHFGRQYYVIVPREDFRENYFLGGQARFTEVSGGDERIHNLPEEESAGFGFKIEIDLGAVGGQMICVSGLEVRARRA